jgi:hypothetical protein
MPRKKTARKRSPSPRVKLFAEVVRLTGLCRERDELIASLRAQVQGRDDLIRRTRLRPLTEIPLPPDRSATQMNRTLFILEKNQAIPLGAVQQGDALLISRAPEPVRYQRTFYTADRDGNLHPLSCGCDFQKQIVCIAHAAQRDAAQRGRACCGAGFDDRHREDCPVRERATDERAYTRSVTR